MSNVKLVWATPDADKQIAYIARVSAPANQANESIEGLLRYMMREKHMSPFEMVNVCVEINTTRDIGRQILRHRSFSFQEFSGRYQIYSELPNAPLRECRMQDEKNRQNSLATDDADLADWWNDAQEHVLSLSCGVYKAALRKGIAKEQARALLPEGLTSSRMYMSGSLRSWITYLKARLDPSTQKEHRDIAQAVLDVLRGVAPITVGAFFSCGGDCMSAVGKWFVMMYSQTGDYVMPLVDDDEEVLLWDTEAIANDAALENNYANAFGFQAYEVGS